MSCKLVREGRLLRLTLARPDKRNALNAALCHDIAEAVDSADPRDTGAVFLDAEGPSFCAGMDLAESLTADAAVLAEVHDRLFTMGRRAAVPVVAYVQGHAIAGGTGLVANAHLVYAAEDARFGLTELRVNLWPFLIYRAVEDAIGARRTLAWTLEAGIYDAAAARDAGLVHRIATHAEALAAARELAERLADTVGQGMTYYRGSRVLEHAEAGELAARLRIELMASDGYRQAAVACRDRKKS